MCNNLVKIYRVIHSQQRIGPYTYSYFNNCTDLLSALTEDEPPFKERLKYKTALCDPKKNKFGVSGFFLQRPGPFEDPGLRSELNKLSIVPGFEHNKNDSNALTSKIVKYFGFSDYDQVFSWFRGDEIWESLLKHGFEICESKERKNKCLFGTKQVMVML